MPKTSFILDGWEYQIIGIGMKNETTLSESERKKLVDIFSDFDFSKILIENY